MSINVLSKWFSYRFTLAKVTRSPFIRQFYQESVLSLQGGVCFGQPSAAEIQRTGQCDWYGRCGGWSQTDCGRRNLYQLYTVARAVRAVVSGSKVLSARQKAGQVRDNCGAARGINSVFYSDDEEKFYLISKAKRLESPEITGFLSLLMLERIWKLKGANYLSKSQIEAR